MTGSSQGIGLGVAQAFAAAGAAVVLTSEKPLESLPEVQRLLSDYPHTRYVQADLLADGEPERLVAEAWAAFGGIDVLVNNLGTYKEPPLTEITREHFDFIFRLNVWVAARGHAGGRPPGRGGEARRAHPVQHVAERDRGPSRCTRSTTRARGR